MAHFVMWTLLIGPWFLLFFFDLQRIKRFVPVGLFASLVLTIVFQLAEKYEWWIIKDNLFFLTNITPYVYGVFLVGTILIFYISYPSFPFFMLVNIVVDLFEALIISPLFQRLGIYEAKNMNQFAIFLLMIAIAALLYFYQKWQDSAFKEELK
ncbi:hypothetical protein [Bacillus sp. CGMCC 1.16541]|uniref:hypothetical protein n=1 Tax=Bacillus sp. CGMCC 1.16541 TaxID=2185143 RepID=UPI000D72CCC7|nr:hypothetical protein [Bacillus sp. CGMCC 1.16541]